MIIEEKIKAATCQVRCGDEVGTGWLVAPNLVATAKHCIAAATASDNAKQIIVEFGLGTQASEHEAELHAVSPDLDFAVIRLEDALDIEPLQWSDRPLRPGTRWVAFGRPTSKLDIGHRLEGSIAQILEGLPSAIDFEVAVDNGSALTEYAGFSGAAVVCDDGCVGVLISTADTAVGGISTARLAPMLRDLSPTTEQAVHAEEGPSLAPRDDFQSTFEETLLTKGTGFLFAEGAPGIGKSTFCERYAPVANGLELIGTYSFSSNENGLNSTYWAQPDVFEDWLRVVHSSTVSAIPARLTQLSYPRMIQSAHGSLSALGKRCQLNGKIGVLFIDGLNEGLRADPHALQRLIGLLPSDPVPGLIVVFTSTNYAEVSGIVGSRVSTNDRLSIPGLTRESVAAFCRDALLPEKASPQLIAGICDRAAGHPLYLRYLIDLVNGGAAEEYLHALPAFSGDIEAYYEAIWPSIAADEHAVQVLGLMARLRWGIPLSEFLSFVDADKKYAFGGALPRIRHLLAHPDATSFYHSSFAQFLSAKTVLFEADFHDQLSKRFRDVLDSKYAVLNRVYHGLQGSPASRTRALHDCSQAWVDQCVVMGVAPDALLDDVDDAVTVATESGSAVETVRLLLLSQRVRYRYNILFADAANLAVRALVAMGQSREALRFMIRQDHLLVPLEEAIAVAVKLIDAGNFEEAYGLLEEIDIRLLESLNDKHKLEDFLWLVHTRIQTMVLMALCHRAPTQEFQSFIQGVKAAIRGASERPNQRESAIFKEIDSNFVASMLCFIDQSSNWLQSLPDTLREALLGPIDQLAAILIGVREQREIYGRQVDVRALKTLVERLEEEARGGIAFAPGARVALSDSLVLLGGSVEVVKALCEEQVETKTLALTFVKDNRALVDIADLHEAYSLQRLRGYIGATAVVLPEARWGNTGWLPAMERLTSDLARWEGAVRAAKITGSPRLDGLWLELEGRILPQLRFTLASRVKWEESYAVPELVVPHLYRMLTQVCIDCYPERLQNLFDMLGSAFEQQCGLYTEGFRSILSDVLELSSREAARLGLVSQVMSLMSRWRSYVLRNVQNRIELVPELLKMIPIFVNLGATEEAARTYQAALSNSMGPNWYKEDQFSMMVDTLANLPADDHAGTAALPRVQSYLDAASGELTFQRFVRYAKQQLLGELCRRGLHHQAVRLFSRQMCGTQDELYTQATTGDLDRVSLLVGMRYPGHELDEQAAVIELVEGCMDGASWRTSWALLEIFHDGDDRHLSRWGKAYARLANRCTEREGNLSEVLQRMRDLGSRRYKDGDRETLLKKFSDDLDHSLHDRFAGLGDPASSTETEIHEAPATASASPQDSGVMPSDHGATAREIDERTPTDEDLNRLYLPGTFGKASALHEAQLILRGAESALAIRNFGAAKAEAIRALGALQSGGWSIWQHSSELTRRAQSILDEGSSTAEEITRLYGNLLQEEKHNYRWVTANSFIKRVSGKLNESERSALCDVVLSHMELLLGDAAPTSARPFDSAVTEGGPETALFSLLIWALDHPRPKTRHEAARMTTWIMRQDDGFLRHAVAHAFSMDPANAPDIIFGALDVLSRESPVRLWERAEAILDSEVSLTRCKHLGRHAVLRRVARRAAEAGSATAKDVLTRIDKIWRADDQIANDAAVSDTVAAPASWGGSGKHEWRELAEFGIANSAIAARAETILRQVCEPLDVTTVRELEDLLTQGFAVNLSSRLGRWEAKVRFALHCALFELAPRELLDRLDDVLRICNPNLLLSPEGDRFPLAQFIAGQQDRWKRFKPQDTNQIFLCYQGMVHSEEGYVLVEVIAFLRPNGGGFGFPPTLEPSFESTELPRPAADDPMLVCAFVKPKIAYFGALTPAILQPRFAQQLGVPPSAVHRSVWHDWTETYGEDRIYSLENATLSVNKSALRLPDGYRLAWVVRFDGKVVGTIN